MNYVIDMPSSLLPFCKNNDIDEIVIATTDRRNNLPIDDLLLCKINGVNVAEFFSAKQVHCVLSCSVWTR